MGKVYKSLSIIIPVYNEKKTIVEIIKRVAVADTLGLTKEIIVVDDGSNDGTPNILRKMKIKNIKKIYLPDNHGKGYALRQGIAQAIGDLVLVQDADLEYNPDDYPLLITPFLFREVKAVFGSRELNINKHSYASFFLGGKLVTFVTWLLYGGRLTDVPTGYKLIERETLKKLNLRCERFEFCPEVSAKLLKKKIPIVEVPIRYKPRKIEEGKKIRLLDGVEAIWTLIKVRIGL